MSENSSYKNILKATSIFGGVQIINIIISIIRSKTIAVLIGPGGMGIFGLFLSTITLISSFTSFGLGTSAVKDISQAHAENNIEKVSIVITIFRRLVWITGFLGFVVMILFAKQLSLFAFDSEKYTNAFRWLSITLLFNQITSGQNALLQGTRNIRSLALSNVIGAIIGLCLSLPVYYFLKVNGIVPAMIITSILAMIIEYYYASKIRTIRIRINSNEFRAIGGSMVTLGFVLSLSNIISVLAAYILRIYISRHGAIADVGFYTAGFNIISSYVGLIFTAMSADYFPRLAAVANNQKQFQTTVNNQGDLSLLILGPILTSLISFINFIVIILYDSRFIQIDAMMQFAALAIFFKAGSWAVSLTFVAKGDNKIFFWNELVVNIYLTIFSIIFYNIWGLQGLGIAYFVSYLIYFVQQCMTAWLRYNFKYSREFFSVLLIHSIISILSFYIYKYFEGILFYLFSTGLCLLSTCFSLYKLNKRIDIKSILTNLFHF